MKKFLKEFLKNLKNVDSYISDYKKITENAGLPTKAYINWGIHLATSGDIDEAIEKFEQSAGMGFNDPDSYLNWGIALAKQEKYEEAIDKFTKALKIDPNFTRAYSLKGAALVEIGEMQEAEEMYKMSMELSPKDPEIYINWGIALARLDDKYKAEKQFKKAISIAPISFQPRFLLGVVLYEQNKLKEAEEAFEIASRIAPANPMPFYYLSLTNTKLEKPDDALRNAKFAFDLDNFRLDFIINLAECYQDVEDNKSALRCYKLAEKIHPDNQLLLISQGIFFQKIKKYKKSIDNFLKAQEKDENDELINFYLAVSYHLDGDLGLAKNLLFKILETNPKHIDAKLRLGLVYQDMENYQDAIDILSDIVLNSQKQVEYYSNLAFCYYKINELEKAIEYYKKGIEYCPSDVKNYTNLAEIYYSQNNIDSALRVIRTGYKNKPNDCKICLIYGKLLIKKGEPALAIEKLDKAILASDKELETYIQKAEALNILQKTEDLKNLKEEIITKFEDDEAKKLEIIEKFQMFGV